MTDTPTLKSYVTRERDILALSMGRWAWPLDIISGFMVTGGFAANQAGFTALPWWIAFGTISFAHGLVSILGTRAAARGRDITNYVRLYDATAIGTGLGWTWVQTVIWPASMPEVQTMIGFFASGAALVVAGVMHPRRWTMLACLALTFGPFTVQHLISNPPASYGSGGMLVLFLTIMTIMGLAMQRFSLKGLTLQWEKDRLVEDLTEARAAADAANAAKSRFLAQASHDLRQPLHAIGLFVESLPDESRRGASGAVIDRVRQSLDVLAKMFDSLLDLTQLDTGQAPVRRVAFRAGELLEQVRAEFAPVAAAAGVELRAARSERLIESDPAILRRMLQNLVANAVRHADGGGVLIGVRRRGGRLAIEVRDTGAGVAEADRVRIFEEFTRLAPAPGAEPSPGLGLGLAIVQRLAQALGASIDLRSPPGRGAVFAIEGLAAAAPDAEPVPLTEAAPAGTPVAVARVLVIDDDAATLEATASLLEKWGCRVQALARWPAGKVARPDLVISDHDLGGGVTGLSVIEALRREHGADLPAVLISGDAGEALRGKAREAGLVLLRKPARPAQLRSALLHAMSRSPEPA